VLPDLCTREITGWAIAARQSALVVTALRMAFDTGRLSIDGIVHTDRGAEGGFNWSSQHLEVEV
jgi:transposase InsO family protein